ATIDVFESLIFEQRMKQMKFMKEHFDKNTITPVFRDFLNNQISYHYFELLLLYSIAKSDDPTGLKASRIPDIMLSEMNSLQLMDERDINSPAYRRFLSNYIRYNTSAQNSFVKFTDYSDMLEREYSYALRYLSGEPFNYWLANELFNYCDKASPETVQKLHRALTQSDLKGDYAKAVSSKCQAEITAKVVKKEKPKEEAEIKEKESKTKEPRKSSQPFTLIDLKGNKVYLDDFKGKVIYVDFWASWCGPCRQQFPYAKELHKMLSPEHLKQVVFLYISIDNDEITWKNAIEKNGIQGFNTLSPGGWSSSAAQYFGVHSIPRYMLIDKNGNIADPNAKRPSSGQEIINDIVRLIKQ
ncbi:MAG TPA: TlpA disulfide reductase family protein, partial [Chitinophagales bacterium]|nr:TlpA disulfide reductase family protein [Chitinophagales bacterium]